MMQIDDSDPMFVMATPEGALSQEDFAALAKAIDGRANASDRVPNLVIRLGRIPHWDSLGAMGAHFHFVREHHRLVKRIAVVGDGPLIALAPEIANLVVEATVRRFPEAKLEDAKAWARSDSEAPGRLEPIEGLPNDVIALRAVGLITGADYREFLTPLIEEKLKRHDKLKMLVVLDEAYTGFTGDALLPDMKLGLKHFHAFTKAALVTDTRWMVKATRLFAPVVPYAVRTFGVSELEEAKEWVRA